MSWLDNLLPATKNDLYAMEFRLGELIMANFDVFNAKLDELGDAIIEEIRQLADDGADQEKVDAAVARVQGYIDSLKADDTLPVPPVPPAPPMNRPPMDV